MHRMLLVALTCAALLSTAITVNADDDKDKKTFTLKDVMKKGFKGGLVKKVASGKADAKEVDTLILMFESMAKAKPKKGDAKSWKEKTDALLSAAKGVKGKTKAAGQALSKAANCKACHNKHK